MRSPLTETSPIGWRSSPASLARCQLEHLSTVWADRCPFTASHRPHSSQNVSVSPLNLVYPYGPSRSPIPFRIILHVPTYHTLHTTTPLVSYALVHCVCAMLLVVQVRHHHPNCTKQPDVAPTCTLAYSRSARCPTVPRVKHVTATGWLISKRSVTTPPPSRAALRVVDPHLYRNFQHPLAPKARSNRCH